MPMEIAGKKYATRAHLFEYNLALVLEKSGAARQSATASICALLSGDFDAADTELKELCRDCRSCAVGRIRR